MAEPSISGYHILWNGAIRRANRLPDAPGGAFVAGRIYEGGGGWRRYALCRVCGLAKREALAGFHFSRSMAFTEASYKK
jgi:hypothetical protein